MKLGEKKVKIFLNTMSILTSGMIAGSLWITKNGNWHIYLPICLMCIVFSNLVNNDTT